MGNVVRRFQPHSLSSCVISCVSDMLWSAVVLAAGSFGFSSDQSQMVRLWRWRSFSPFEVLQLHRVSQQLQELCEGRSLLVVPEQLLLRHLVDRWHHTASQWVSTGAAGPTCLSLLNSLYLSKFLEDNPKLEGVVHLVLVVAHYELRRLETRGQTAVIRSVQRDFRRKRKQGSELTFG